MYMPSASFRAEMAVLLAPAGGPGKTPERREAIGIAAKGRTSLGLSWLMRKPIPAFIACVLAIVGIVILWRASQINARANAFVDIAMQTHRQQLAGHLPLQVTTNSPSEMSTWFAGKVPFHFRLPTSQEADEQRQRYELRGGRLINFRATRAAYVAYGMQKHVISLVVTSASISVASGGEETISKGLTFHTHRKGELQVVTWSVHNLTYALVSGVNVPASESCAVCHASAKEKDLIRDLRSLNKQRADGNSIDAHVLFTLCDKKDHRKKL
jgi:hypothetical protein